MKDKDTCGACGEQLLLGDYCPRCGGARGACEKCNGDGVYCWTCGEREVACECDPGDENLGDCTECSDDSDED